MLPLLGVILLDKPAGPSSAAAVNRVKRLLPRGTRIGHAGTLDPFATGLLLLLVGKATKFSQSVMDQHKSYDATVKLGASTATDDIESEEIPVEGARPPKLLEIRQAAEQMTGIIQQTPPDFSAKKIAGRRACDLIRSGKTVHLKANAVRIDRIEILDWDWPLLKLRIDCGRGTYVRSIARDLGRLLETGGYLTELRRTRIGPYTLDKSVTLDRLTADGVQPHLRAVISPQAAF
ncbi:MAG: tRNA pseudouridine(55) synthase TruB [Tepidisphaeraceae bacterium]|jgi:tRNA pseudouridine55 synthase